jgi:poly-gamma-glutamate synthesis protein (capsule biosynthesis protein)
MFGDEGDNPDFYGIAPRVGWPLLPVHPDSCMTALTWAAIVDNGTNGIKFLFCRLTPGGKAFPLDLDSPERKKVVD